MRDEDKNRLFFFWITNISFIGNQTLGRMLQDYHSVSEIYETNVKELAKRYKWNDKKQAEFAKAKAQIEKTIHTYYKMEEKGIRFVLYSDADYPERLKSIPNAPYVLYLKGKLPDPTHKSIAIVGARNCSYYGAKVAKELGELLAQANIDVISGMARGIDGIVQKSVLANNGNTYGVLGSGIDICYPKENIELYMDLSSRGGLISETPLSVAGQGFRFPLRNRIISGLSDAVLVVEGKRNSGSLSTVDHALLQNKDIWAVPGRINDELSQACNQLISQGAYIYNHIEDLLTYFQVDLKTISNLEVDKKLINLTSIPLAKEELLLYSDLDLQPKHVEEILACTGLPASDVICILMKLEGYGMIVQPARNYFCRAQ